MPIALTQIPANLLVPGQYEEIDNSLAGAQGDIKKVLIMAYKTASAPAPAGKPVQVLTASKAAELCGYGSPAAVMAGAFLDINKTEECWILPVAEPEGGTKWRKSFTVTASAAGEGAVSITVNGATLAAAVGAGATAGEIAAAIVARINSETNLPVEAAADEGVVTVSSLVKGTWGNQNTVSLSTAVSGITIIPGAVTAGTGVGNLALLFPSLGGVRYHYFLSDFDDPANIAALDAETESRYSALRQIGGRAFIALSGQVGSATEEGSLIAQAETVNSPHIVLIPRLENAQLPGEWAARFAAPAIRRLADDPAANTYDIQVDGLTADAELDFDTRQKLLEAGIATWRLDPVGKVLIERLVTSYTENSDGGRDTSYLDVQVTETVDAVRTYINAEAKKRYKTWKLAATEENFGAGSRVMTPGVFRSFLADLYLSVFIQEKQWCQDFEAYKASILVEIMAGSKTRLQYQHQPVLIGQFLIGSGLLQFK
ncbi:MAG: phage tail sheath protein [Treponema sp.]|jgi:phage tail sheath gpL-like|nr:phage tail sheath protein [Treponema sp.]